MKGKHMIGKSKELIVWLVEQNPETDFEIKEYKRKRSRNANNYAWFLITKIANVLRLSKEEVYLTMLKRYGQSELISVLSEIDINKYIKYYEQAGTSKLNGKNFTHYKVYMGSSEYDSRQMSILIDGIVQEAQNLRIETLPPIEIERLKNAWNQ